MRNYAILAVLAVSLPLLADDFWVKKPYTQWSREECEKLLKNSPWTQASTLNQVSMTLANQEPSDQLGANPGADVRAGTPFITYVVQLSSALPIRQAIVRQQWIANNVDALPADRQAQIKQRAESFVSAPVGDVVLVHVAYGSNNQQLDRVMAGYWQHQTLDKLKDLVNLIAGKRRVAPIEFDVAPGAAREFELTFPRVVESSPLLSGDDKVLALEFRAPGIGIGGSPSSGRRGRGSSPSARTPDSDTGLERFYIPFKPKEMVLNGQLFY